MGNKKDNLHLSTILFYLLIVAFCINLFGRGSIFCLMFGVISLFFLPKKINFDFACLITTVLSVVVFVFGSYHFGFNEGIKGLNFGLMYFVGNQMYKKVQEKETFMKRVVFSVFFGISLLIILLYFKNSILNSFGQTRILVDIWGNRKISVTLVGMLTSFIIGYSFYGILFCKNILVKIYTILALLVAFLTNIMTATRTPFVLYLITAMMFLLIYSVKFKNFKKNIKIVAVIIIFGLIIFLCFNEYMLVIHKWLVSSPIFKRFSEEGMTTSRVEIFRNHYDIMSKYLWGGAKISSITGSNAHNIIQESYDLYGLFAMMLMIALIISVCVKLVKLLILRNKTNFIYLLICIYFVFIIQVFLEPTLSGYPCYVFSFLLIYGSTNSYINSLKI